MEQDVSEKLRDQLTKLREQLARSKQAIKDAATQARKEALEASLQSMVRLCVVAPTVNVHFNSQQQACKAPMPNSRIKDIIENDVLPNFSSLFIQLEEGQAKNGGRLDAWRLRRRGGGWCDAACAPNRALGPGLARRRRASSARTETFLPLRRRGKRGTRYSSPMLLVATRQQVDISENSFLGPLPRFDQRSRRAI